MLMSEKIEKKTKTKKIKELTAEDIMKLEIAKEIGVIDKVVSTGWKSLSAKESGRIGGILSSRKRAEKKAAEKEAEKAEESDTKHAG